MTGEKIYVIRPSGTPELPARLSVAAGESLRVTFLVLPGADLSLPLEVELTAPGARVELNGLYLGAGAEQVDFRVTLRHSASDTVSRQLFKGIASGRAHARYYGRVIVDGGLRAIDAAQESHHLLLSPEARVETLPQLEIYSDDVQCSHGTSVGALDEQEQFYLRSRGVPLQEARALQMLSFLSPVLSGIGDPALREEMQAEAEQAVRKLSGI